MVMPFRERKKEQPEKEPEEKVGDISVPMKGNMTFGAPVNLRINGDFA